MNSTSASTPRVAAIAPDQSLKGVRVALVNMPFAAPESPSIGLGLLKAHLERAGATTAVLDLNLDFALMVGDTAYTALSEVGGIGVFAGEYVFAHTLYRRPPSMERYAAQILDAKHPDQPFAQNDQLFESVAIGLELAEPFLDQAEAIMCETRPHVIGFTSMFQQHVASLALARRLRESLPDAKIIIGGPNCDGTMGAETARSFPFLDAVMLGEADEVIVDLVAALMGRHPLESVPGAVTPKRAVADFAAASRNYAPRVQDMDALPEPDYSDYVASREALRLDTTKIVAPFESSRGCWWGEKNHCVFCGINAHAMPYRSKSADRVLNEITALQEAFPRGRLSAVDNIIEHRNLSNLLDALEKAPLSVDLFYEIKSNLSDAQIGALRRAGIKRVQPGIESLDSEILTMMNKGVTGIQNTQLLKACETHGVSVFWNFLWGFPHEPRAAYDRMITLMSKLWHLAPPGSVNAILMNRYAPHFEESERFGFQNLRPFPAYSEIYELPPDRLANLAYYFCFDYAPDEVSKADPEALRIAASEWQDAAPKAYLFRKDDIVVDGLGVTQKVIRLEPSEAQVLECCETIIPEVKLRKHCAGMASLDDILARLINQNLLLREDKKLLALPIEISRYDRGSDLPNWKLRQRKVENAMIALGEAACKQVN